MTEQDERLREARRIGLKVCAPDPSRPMYLRVGTWDASFPISRNYSIGDFETGLSVYELDAEGCPITPSEGEWSEIDLNARLNSDAPKFLVQGNVVGWGGDGEPVLADVCVVGVFELPEPRPQP